MHNRSLVVAVGVGGKGLATRKSCKMRHFRPALVLYGSETGNAQDIAEEVGDLTTRHHFFTTVLDFDSIDLRQLRNPTIVIFVVSTTGQGEFPQNARSFWKTLLSSVLKPGVSLRKLRFTSFGLGDSSYPKFNVAHRMLYGRLAQLGAQPFCDRGEGNEQHPEGHSAGFREWIGALKQGLIKKYPLPDGQQPIAEDVFLEPAWKLTLFDEGHSRLDDAVNGFRNLTAQSTSSEVGKRSKGDVDISLPINGECEIEKQRDTPSPHPLPVRSSHNARIISNDRITTPGHFQDVRLLDLQLDLQLSYGPGAVAVVYPKNFPSDVRDFIELMHWADVADAQLQLSSNDKVVATPSPLGHFELHNVKMSLRWLLENVIDIMSIPRRSFFSNLLHFVDLQHSDGEYQKERLLELANPELIDELWDYTTRPKRTILEVMSDFTTVRIPWQYCLSVLPMMRGRQFSIASGGALKRDESGRTKIELLVAIADPPSPIIKYRRRYGVCTRYIATLIAGQHINIGLQPGYLDAKADDMHAPTVMVGPGTGVAPIRSLIHQHVQWANELGVRPHAQALNGDMLFFGCRDSTADHFFRDEWTWAKELGLKYFPAFSRDKEIPRAYVQDQIRAQGELVYQALVKQRGRIYVCGSSGNMPKGVREAVTEVLCEHGGMAREQAEEMVVSMEKEERYKQETW